MKKIKIMEKRGSGRERKLQQEGGRERGRERKGEIKIEKGRRREKN